MRLEALFRLSTYLTLVLASLCLGYSEDAYLPGILACCVPVGMLLGLAYMVEGRWVLSLFTANILGIFIAAGAGVWIAYQLLRSQNEQPDVAGPAGLLPYVGPILMVLMLAKLFRPKQVVDFWLLHMVGFMEVVLASVLVSEPFFGLLLFGYLACGLWSLTLFHLQRENRRAKADRRSTTFETLTPALQRSTRPVSSIDSPWRAVGWACCLVPLALAAFLLTPQLGETKWDPFRLTRPGVTSVGYSSGIDLNHTGHVRTNNTIAFEVHVEDAWHRPKLDISPSQRWRGTVMDHYEQGHWLDRSLSLTPPVMHVGALTERRNTSPMPDLGSEQSTYTFHVDSRKAHGLFLAEPIVLPGSTNSPLSVVPLAPDSISTSLFQAKDGTLLPSLYLQPGEYSYRQQTLPYEEMDLGPPIAPESINLRHYCQQPIAGVQTWTAELLSRLIKERVLTTEDVGFPSASPKVEWNRSERVARAISAYLADSGDYTYSLDLRRTNSDLDPIEDFLLNEKNGHCTRFASALTLILRSCNIPARVVVGFRGASTPGTGDDAGKYVIRQNQAHSWVEAVIERRSPAGQTQYHWLTLDPTPSLERHNANDAAWKSGWNNFRFASGILWRDFVVDYNSDQRSEAAEAIASQLDVRQRWNGLLNRIDALGLALDGYQPWMVSGSLVLLLMGISVRRRRGLQRSNVRLSHANTCELHARLLRLLESQLLLKPRPTETPLEFATQVSRKLGERPATLDVAAVPTQVVEYLYRFSYGPQRPSEVEERELARRLDELAMVLAGGLRLESGGG